MGGSSVSGGGSKNKSKAGSQGQFSQDVWGGQSGALGDLYNAAGSLFGSTLGNLSPMMQNASSTMNQTADAANQGWQNQMQGGAYSGLGIGNQLMSSLNASQNSPSAMQEVNNMIMGGSGNNYADAMKNQYMQDATDAQNNMMANMDARAAASGMSGGSRHGTAMAQGMKDINQNLQSNMAQTGFNTFDKDLDRKLQIAGQADANNFNRQQLMGNMLGQQQGAMAGGVNSAGNMQQLGMGQFAPQMMPWQAMGQYANTIGAPTVLSSGSTSASSNSKGSGKGGSVSG